VQRRHRLAGARAALDDQDARQRGADHPVLLGLDGGDHVVHAAGAPGGDAGHQHGLAGQGLPVRLGQPAGVEDLVVDAGDGAVPGVDVPAPDQAGRVLGGGGVEGLRGGGAPVDELGFLLVVAQADPADVQGGAELAAGGGLGIRGSVASGGDDPPELPRGLIGHVDTAEAQAVLDRVQLGQPPGLFRRRNVSLDPGLESPPGLALAVRPGKGPLSPVPRHIEQAVKHVNINLLLGYGRRARRRARGFNLTGRHYF